MSLMFSISGLRGIVNEDLTAGVVLKYAYAFGKFLKPGKVVIGRDARKSGKTFSRTVIRGLNAAGCSVIDLGIVPTPTVLFMVRKLNGQGGIIITASHNPVEWNALKFVSRKGQFLQEQEHIKFLKFINNLQIVKQSPRKFSNVNELKSGVNEHINKIVGVMKLRSVKFGIGVDAVNGAGSICLPRLLEKIGCKVYRLNCKFSPNFPRGPEPTPENIKALCHLVKKNRLDFGFAVDPDCDRLSIVDENGEAIGEENTLALATDYILSKTKGNVVTNLSTTALLDYVVRKHDGKLYRTKVGEANVVAEMQRVKAIIGGEGNGGVIYPKINFTRDALVGAAIILKLLVERNRSISRVLVEYPRYHMIKKKIKIGKWRFDEQREKIIRAFEGKINFIDGIRITGQDYWLHIRPSQTEPIIRIIGEAREKRKIEKYIEKVENLLK